MNATAIPVDTFLGLLLVASATAVCVKWIKMPYAVALVLAGLAIGLSHIIPPVVITPELVLRIFLPALLFEASWNLDIRALKRDWLPISVLATIGVVVCMLGVAGVLHLVTGLNLQTALLFGAMVSATDPVSVIALFRQIGIDKRLTTILEGESLFNDGTAVVLFQLMLGIVVSGAAISLPTTIGQFFVVVLGGILVGVVLGYFASRITRAFDDHLLETTLTVVTAYGALLAADKLHVSTVLAVVAAGIVFGNYGSRTGMSATTRLAVDTSWEYAAFLVNSLLFLLIGLQVQVPLLVKYAPVIGFAVAAVILGRLIVVYGICPFVSTDRLPIPDKWRHLLFWGGLRGALVMALALSLPLSFPDREALVNMTFGVVLFTLLVPGLTMGPLIKLLRMAPKDALRIYQESKSLLLAYRLELKTLSEFKEAGLISQHTFHSVENGLRERIDRTQRDLEEVELSDASIDQLELRTTKIQLMELRKDHLKKLSRQGVLSAECLHKLNLSIDSELDLVQQETSPGASLAKLPAKTEDPAPDSPTVVDDIDPGNTAGT